MTNFSGECERNEPSMATSPGCKEMMVALVTSHPELANTLAATKIDVDNVAIGDFIGSNMFNLFFIGFSVVFFTQERFLAVIVASFLLIGVVSLFMMGMGLIGNLEKMEIRIWLIEADALALNIIYLLSLWLLYSLD